jgi:hypothetical protein
MVTTSGSLLEATGLFDHWEHLDRFEGCRYRRHVVTVAVADRIAVAKSVAAEAGLGLPPLGPEQARKDAIRCSCTALGLARAAPLDKQRPTTHRCQYPPCCLSGGPADRATL